MELPLVVGVDGSESSFEALDWAADAAARHRRGLRVVAAPAPDEAGGVIPSASAGRPEPESVALDALAAAGRRAGRRRPDVETSLDASPDEPVEALLDAGHNAFALVVGWRGRGPLERMLLGSVSLAVAGRAACPSVVVRGGAMPREGRYGRVVVGVDGSREGAAAVRFALQEAAARGSRLTAVHAWRTRAGVPGGAGVAAEEARELLAAALRAAGAERTGVPVSPETVQRSPRTALLTEAETADLLVVGAHHRGDGPDGLRLGLISHALVHYASCPVAVTPHP